MFLKQFLEYLKSTWHVSSRIESKGSFELSDELESRVWNLPEFSDEFVDEYRFFFSFYLDTIELAEYEKCL